jgi:glucose-1-phosphate cytidylyltransferase
MQVVILCGGQGTRIRDVADDLPKPMIPIGSRPILWHVMKRFADYGFADFILCLGYQSWVIKRYFLDYDLASDDVQLELGASSTVERLCARGGESWRLILAETGRDAMTGCRIKRIEPYVRGDDFLLTYADGLADIDLARLVQFHRSHGRIGTVSAVRPPGRYGELELDGSEVVEFNEKPCESRGWINGGYFVFQRRIFERLHDDPGLVFEQGPLTQLARNGELWACPHTGFWQAMDTRRDYQELNDLWSRGQAPWNSWDRPRLRVAA